MENFGKDQIFIYREKDALGVVEKGSQHLAGNP
jgi:hypothetical protein